MSELEHNPKTCLYHEKHCVICDFGCEGADDDGLPFAVELRGRYICRFCLWQLGSN